MSIRFSTVVVRDTVSDCQSIDHMHPLSQGDLRAPKKPRIWASKCSLTKKGCPLEFSDFPFGVIKNIKPLQTPSLTLKPILNFSSESKFQRPIFFC